MFNQSGGGGVLNNHYIKRNYQTAEVYLQAVCDSILFMRERIETIRSGLSSTQNDLSVDRVQTSVNINRIPDGIANIIKFENSLSNKAAEGMRFIGQLESSDMRRILTLRYICNVQMKDIAVQMGIGRTWLYELWNNALNVLNSKLE